MQALGLGLASVLGVGGGKFLYGQNQGDRSGSSRSSSRTQQPTVLTVSPSNGGGVGLSHLLFAGALGAGAVMVLGGLQWIRREDTAKRLKPHLEHVEKATLKQVRKADENSADRDKRLDLNSKLRMKKMQSEIVGEGRANFDVLSQQIHCLTQIALQTLTTMAKPTTPGGEGMEEEVEKQRQKILDWTRNAQSEADKLADPNNVSTARAYHKNTLRAEIPGLSSPGGGEVKEEEPISIGPHILKDKREKRKKKKEGKYMTAGLVSVGSLALLYSVYIMFSPASPPE